MSETESRMALRATELWDLSHTLARPWLEKTEYPWEVLPDLESIIRAEYPQADVQIELSAGLCMFYAEIGGMMVGYEDAK